MSQAIFDGTVEFTVRGRLGNSGAAELDAAFGSLPEGIATVVLDLGGVDYVSSPGLRLLASRAIHRMSWEELLVHSRDPLGEFAAGASFLRTLAIGGIGGHCGKHGSYCVQQIINPPPVFR